MYVRVVRFTEATSERVEQLTTRLEQSEGPPEGVPAMGVQLLFDEAKGSAVVLQIFDTADDMRRADEVMNAMGSSETPGTRVSVDMCEVKAERRRPSSEEAGTT